MKNAPLALMCGLVLGAPLRSPAAEGHPAHPKSYFLPDAAASKILTVAPADYWDTSGITMLTEAVAIKETGPKETIARFGETYAFSPSFITLYRDKPTTLHFRNLQPDDEHDFSVLDRNGKEMMDILLPPLKETSYVFTFHQAGLFDFKCLTHQPGMSGQILVLAPETKNNRL
jgi:plastocyanin